MPDDGNDEPQGIEAVRAAALDAVRQHMSAFPYSTALEDLWENHPLLIESEAMEAGKLACFVANQFHETMTEAAVFMFTKRIS